ncbi:hypothetical protein HK098_004999, partial [Nowakowskiella sp. JEL0407]
MKLLENLVKSNASSKGKNLHYLLQTEIENFLSVWYPKPTDSNLVSVIPSPEQLARIGDGYANRRWQHLNQAVIHGLIDGRNSEVESKKLVVKKVFVPPYRIPNAEANLQIRLFDEKNTDRFAISVQGNAKGDQQPAWKSQEEFVNSPFDIPDPGLLSFNSPSPIIQFTKSPFSRDLFLQNRSASQNVSFYIQTFPDEYFETRPSFGTISKGDSTLITVTFKPCPYANKRNSEINGFLRVRSADGVPLERLALRGHNLPAAKVQPELLKFGKCPRKESRNQTIILTNFLPVECVFVLVLIPSTTSEFFSIPSTQITVPPKEKSLITINFTPLVSGPCKDTLVVIAQGIEKFFVTLDGTCGDSIRIAESKIDMGPVDIYYGAATRTMLIKSLDDRMRLSVLINCSTDELEINDNRPIHLEPLQEKKVKVSFKSAYTGDRTETMTFSAPNSTTKTVDVLALSGPAVMVPIMEDIFFPTMHTHSTSSVQIPATNVSNNPVQISFTLPIDAPFLFKVLNADFCNRPSTGNASAPFELSNSETVDSSDIILTIPPKMTAVVVIESISPTTGTFRVPLQIQMIKPRKWAISTHYLNVAVVSDHYLNRDKPMNLIRKFISSPSTEHPTGLFGRKLSPSKAPNQAITSKSSEVFEIDPPTQMIFGAHLIGTMDDVYETITINNVTSVNQKYHIIFSSQFITEIPLDGELEPLTTLDIPIRLNPSYFRPELNDEMRAKIAIGSITILDENTKRNGMVTSALFGMWGDLASIELRNKTETIKFPALKPGTKSNRKLVIRNRAFFEVQFEARFLVIGQKGLQSESSTPTEWCPFSMSHPKIGLKPFEYFVLDVNFQSPITGEFKVKMFMDYIDPISHVCNGETVRGKTKRSLTPITLSCSVIAPDIVICSDVIDFGEVPIGEIMERDLVITNNQPTDIPASIFCPDSFKLNCEDCLLLKKNNKRELKVKFNPMDFGTNADIFYLNYTGATRLIMLLGVSGKLKVTTNLAVPYKLENANLMDVGIGSKSFTPSKSSIIDLGFVNIHKPTCKLFRFTNSGTLDFVVKAITAQEGGNLTWKFVDETYFTSSKFIGFPDVFFKSTSNLVENWTSFSSEAIEEPEIDWDEVDFLEKEKQNKLNEGEKKPQTTTTVAKRKKNKNAVVNQNALTVSQKAFPIRLAPFQSLWILLNFSGNEKGEFTSALQFDGERMSGEPENYAVWIRGNIQSPLTVREKKIEFGICPAHIRHFGKLCFTNNSEVALKWNLSLVNVEFIPVTRYEASQIPSDHSAIPAPIELFPKSGSLIPGCTQTVDVVFTPSIPQYEVVSLVKLKTEDFAETAITVHGVGATSKLIVDVESLNFGILRVGTRKIYKFHLKNRGILRTRYFAECTNTQFSVDPEQGLLESEGQVELTIKFSAQTVGMVNAFLKISTQQYQGYKSDPITIPIIGTGSYPELVVLTKMVDFGTALFNSPNRKPITVQNKGAAEAHIVLTCHHPPIQLDKDGYEGSDGIVIPPHETKDIYIVYTPLVVEYLDIKAYLKSSDTRGDYFMIQLKGTVGIPKLTITPKNFLSELDFGVCSVGGIYKRKFSMKNEGNISLTYALNLTPLTKAPDGTLVPLKLSTKTDAYDNNALGAIYFQPSMGSLAVGEEVETTVAFIPPRLADFFYSLNLSYEFRSITSIVKGTGGCAILKIDSPLRLVDFGVCRIKRVFRKCLTVTNAGNLGIRYHLRPEPDDRDWNAIEKEIQLMDKTVSNEEMMLKMQKHAGHSNILQHRQPEFPDESMRMNSTSEHDESLPEWAQKLKSLGFSLKNADGYCLPHSKTDLEIEFCPSSANSVSARLRVYFGDQHEDFDIRGRSAISHLTVFNSNNDKLASSLNPLGMIETLNLGVHPVNSEYVHTLQLKNEGPFGIDYLVQPIGIREYEVYPERGYIESDSSTAIKIFFQPTSESRFHLMMKILWEREPLRINLTGSGGIGKLEVLYIEEKDAEMKGLDFGMVPFNSACEKRFQFFNIGMVEVTVRADVDNADYSLALIGDTLINKQQAKPSSQSTAIKNVSAVATKRNVWNWGNYVKFSLPPSMGQEIATKFIARSPTLGPGSISVKSECGSFLIPLRGKGGTIAISHKGDLSFGDIASNFTYNRKIIVCNSGSIPATLTMEWMIVGHSNESRSGTVQLNEVYSGLDPRSGWAKTQLFQEKGITDKAYRLTAKDRWRLIQHMIKKLDTGKADSERKSRLWGSSTGRASKYYGTPAAKQQQNTPLLERDEESETDLLRQSSTTTTSGNSGKIADRLKIGSGSQTSQHQKKGLNTNYSAHFKRRQMFFHLITTTALTSQSLPNTKPHIKVEPPTCLLPSYGEAVLSVDINLSTEETFLATLVIKPNVPSTPAHEIALTATPKAVNIVCDDTRVINFYRQPIGETEVIVRNFTNVGHKDINFSIQHQNSSLTVSPGKGVLKLGQTIPIQFIFQPVDETVQTGEIFFEPDCSQPIKLKMYGGGGYCKASLSRYRRFDFGHCMIGKDTVSFLPVVNEGNAILHLVKFELAETDTFFRGVDWPRGRISLFPGKSFNLPIVFNPHEESPHPGKLIVGTISETYEIELIGLGREAVLIVSKLALEFSECIIGNSYEQKLVLKNVGDVNYPVTFKLEKDFPDLEFIPPALVINPFSEMFVIVAYTPTRETKQSVMMTVSSPYSSHKIPLILHAGLAILEFSEQVLDFGMFERNTRPSVSLTVKNIGTVRTAYSIKDASRPSKFHIQNSRGMLYPQKQSEVIIAYNKREVCQFSNEKLLVRTDLIDKIYTIAITGQCEEAVLKPEEFSFLNVGVCPVLESSTKPLSFKNYGRFPLQFNIKVAYPLKVIPMSGTVLGGSTASINVIWNPSGGYELRTQITMQTNIGSFNITVRGKSALPELSIKSNHLDFGVCAIGFTYTEIVSILNKGKVPLNFTIPTIRDPCYSVSILKGSLYPKETAEVEVYFRPTSLGRFVTSLMIECKGINYKEVEIVGIGGQMKLEISPSVADIGQSPCNLCVMHTLTLTNMGDVTLEVNFAWEEEEYDEQTDGETAKKRLCSLALPTSVLIPPNRSVSCSYGVTAYVRGQFTTKLTVLTKEKNFYVPIKGQGVEISMSPASKVMLETENLDILKIPDPFTLQIPISPLEQWLISLSRIFTADLQISALISQLLLILQSPPLTTADELSSALATHTSLSKPISRKPSLRKNSSQAIIPPISTSTSKRNSISGTNKRRSSFQQQHLQILPPPGLEEEEDLENEARLSLVIRNSKSFSKSGSFVNLETAENPNAAADAEVTVDKPVLYEERDAQSGQEGVVKVYQNTNEVADISSDAVDEKQDLPPSNSTPAPLQNQSAVEESCSGTTTPKVNFVDSGENIATFDDNSEIITVQLGGHDLHHRDSVTSRPSNYQPDARLDANAGQQNNENRSASRYILGETEIPQDQRPVIIPTPDLRSTELTGVVQEEENQYPDFTVTATGEQTQAELQNIEQNNDFVPQEDEKSLLTFEEIQSQQAQQLNPPTLTQDLQICIQEIRATNNRYHKRLLIKNLLEQLRDFIRSGFVTVEHVKTVFELIMEIKREEYISKQEPLPEDKIVEDVLGYPYLKVTEIDLEEILSPQIPSTNVNLDIITNRPPAISKENDNSLQRGPPKYNQKQYAVFPSLKKKDRNAKTSTL